MLVATLGFTIMQTIIKELSNFHVSQIVFFRAGITSALCLIYLKRKGISFLPNRHGILILRTIFGITSMVLFFITVQRMPLGASVSLKYLSPVFTAIFAVILIKEKVKPFQWILFATALSGVFLLKGFDPRIDTLNLILGVIGAVLAGLVYVLIRKIGKSEHPMVIVNYFMGSATILGGIWMINHWVAPTMREWILLLIIGLCGYVGQVYMTRAFQAEEASRVVPIKYVEVIYSLFIGFFFFGEGYSWLSLLGIFLIVGSMFLNLRTKN